MSTVDKFGIARLLNPENEQLIGQQRVNAEIFMAMEILGRKLERSETERDRLTRRLALIESAATVDAKTGKLYLPVVMDPAAPPRVAERATSGWVVAASLMSCTIALFALSLTLFHEPQPALTQEQVAMLDTMKTSQFSLRATPENNAWKRPAAEAPMPEAPPELARQEQTAEASKLADVPVVNVPAVVAIAPQAAPIKAPEPQPAELAKAERTLSIPREEPVKVVTAAEAPAQDLPPDSGLPEKLAQLEARAYHGIPEAQHDMATLYASGKLVAQNYTRAIYWFTKSADGGVANANYNLGVIYQQGLGGKADMPKALAWYAKAAELGHPEAMYNLGIAYLEGIGTKADIEKGVSYFKRAAKAGVALAAHNLGVLYESNFIGAIDTDKALEWYRVAADTGHAEARTAVARLSGAAADQALTLADTTEPAAGGSSLVDGNNRALAPKFKNDLLAKVQQELVHQGLLSGAVDGLMTPQTEDAIRAHQKKLGLREDGLASEVLLDNMQKSASAGK